MLSDWLKIFMCLGTANQCALFQHSAAIPTLKVNYDIGSCRYLFMMCKKSKNMPLGI